jgi:type I restriction enzyme, S subunit
MKNKLQKYDKYKPSGVEWLGEIPQHWEVTRIKNLFKEINERSMNGNEDLLSVSQYTGVTKKGDKVEEGELLTNAATLEGYKKVFKGDLVSNIMLAWNGSLGFSEFEGITSPAYSIYRLKVEGAKNYFHYLFRTELYKSEFKRNSSGVIESRLRLYTDDFFRIPSILPPLSEQEKIAQFLDEKTTKIDKAIEIKQRQIELLKERRQILIHRAVTRGVGSLSGVETPLKDSGVEWIGEIPEHWEVVPVRRIIDVRDGTHDTPLYVEDGLDSFPLVTSKDFDGDLINFENIKKISKKDHYNISKRSGVKKGDVLMSMIGGNIGKSVIIGEFDDFSIKNVALFKTNHDINLAKFLRFYFESGLLQKQIDLKSRGGAQGFLSLGDIRNLVFFKIPAKEIEKIVSHIENISAKISKAIGLKEREIEVLKEYKSSLINSAVTGKVKIG